MSKRQNIAFCLCLVGLESVDCVIPTGGDVRLVPLVNQSLDDASEALADTGTLSSF